MADIDYGKLPEKFNSPQIEEAVKRDKYGRIPNSALKRYGWFRYNFNTLTYRGKLNTFYLGVFCWGSFFYALRRKLKKNKAKAAAAPASH